MKHWHQVQQELSMFISFQNITDKHPYYAKLGSLAWQNSIRHNLSLLPEFVKVGGTSGKGPGGGKGHLWTIKPGVDEQRLTSLFRDDRPIADSKHTVHRIVTGWLCRSCTWLGLTYI